MKANSIPRLLPDPIMLDSCLQQSAAMHKHLCPRQVLGVRIGMYAAELFALELPQKDKRLHAFIETDGCFVDGITISTGCSLGHRTLHFFDHGKVAATFVDTKLGRAIRVWPNPNCRKQAHQYAPTAPNRWTAQLNAYQVLPSAALLCSSEVELALDLKALIAVPGIRVNCSACGEEIINQREVKRRDSVLCRSCAGGSYYRTLEETGS